MQQTQRERERERRRRGASTEATLSAPRTALPTIGLHEEEEDDEENNGARTLVADGENEIWRRIMKALERFQELAHHAPLARPARSDGDVAAAAERDSHGKVLQSVGELVR